MKNAVATHTYIIVFGFTRSELELMIYHTRDKHAHHCHTDTVRLRKHQQLPSRHPREKIQNRTVK
jgi:hypothetical protein